MAGPFSGLLVAHRGLGVLRYPQGQAHGIYNEPGPNRTSSKTKGGRNSVPSHPGLTEKICPEGKGAKERSHRRRNSYSQQIRGLTHPQIIAITPSLTEARLAGLHTDPVTAPGIYVKETTGQVPRGVNRAPAAAQLPAAKYCAHNQLTIHRELGTLTQW